MGRRREDRGRRSQSGMVELLEPRRLLVSLPAGFSETLVTTNSDLSAATAMEFSPDGQLFVLEQGGRLKLVRGDGTTHTSLTLTVDPAGERGLLGIAFAPNYDGSGPNTDYVYLYYTTPRTSTTNPAHNRISRFTVSNAGTSTPTLGSEVILRELPPEDEDNNLGTNGDTNHNGGAIHFGPDGKLYVAVGDHNYDNTPQSAHVSQVLTNPFGKMLRLNADGTNASDNPFYTGSSSNWEGAIWARGLRNPYTFAIQPGTGRVFINDVGEAQWEEINDGVAGANYGWAGSTSPLWEGFEGTSTPWTNYHDPIMAYDHSDASGAPAGCAITGGVFYEAGKQFGSAYAGKYFFADFCGGFIRVFDPATPGTITNPDRSTAFASSLTGGAAVDLKVNSAGALYYLSRGSTGIGEIYRITFQAPQITQHPSSVTVDEGSPASFMVVASGSSLSYQWQKLIGETWSNISGATSATYTIPSTTTSHAGQYRAVVSNSAGSATSNAATLTVNAVGQAPTITSQPTSKQVNVGQNTSFTVGATGTAPLSYQWQKLVSGVWQDISGATSSTYTINNVTTGHAGQYRAVVSNSFGSDTSNSATLTVNSLPTASISAPATYTFGQTINFSATASDPDDGTLPASAYSWRVDFGHDSHFHPHVATFSGATGGSFVADFNETDPDQFYRIVLTVTDSDGATFTTTRDVQPVKVQITLASSPSGAQLSFDGQPVSGPVESVVNSPHTIQAPATATIGGQSYNFSSWSDGGAATHTITTPASNATYTATYTPAAGTSVKVNFQDGTSQGMTGYLADVGSVFGSRGNGWSYGWDVNNAANARNRNSSLSPNEAYDTLTHLQRPKGGRRWEIAVPNGTYNVLVVAGDADFSNSVYRINVENVLALSGTPTSSSRWITGTATVNVTDGRLTVTNGSNAKNNKICFIELTSASSSSTSGTFQQSGAVNGLISIEAEHSQLNFSVGGMNWLDYSSTTGFSGSGAMRAMPNNGVLVDTNYVTTTPRLDYRINFVKTGIHYVWLRGIGATINDDSVHVGLNGSAISSADRFSIVGSSSYGWSDDTMDGVRATINVTSVGVHTLNLWMREDGTIVDKLVLTTDSAFTPSGTGPLESPMV